MMTPPILGVRVWTVDVDPWSPFQPRLLPAHFDHYTWSQDGATRAHCSKTGTTRGLGHMAPEQYCECGLYAYAKLRRARHEATVVDRWASVIGLVRGWGRIVPHGHQGRLTYLEGFRAEYMRPIAFLKPKNTVEIYLAMIAKNLATPILTSRRQLHSIARLLVEDGGVTTIAEAYRNQKAGVPLVASPPLEKESPIRRIW